MLQENIKKRFRLNQEDVVLTLLSYLSALDSDDVAALTERLRLLSKEGLLDQYEDLGIVRTDQDVDWFQTVKMAHWQKLKLVTITKSLTAIYGLCGLFLLLKVQLNLIGRSRYIASCDQIEGLTGQQLSPEVEKAYLSKTQYFIQEGYSLLEAEVYQKVEQVFKQVSLTDKFTVDALLDLMAQIKVDVVSYLWSAQEDHLSQETQQILQGEDVQKVLDEEISTTVQKFKSNFTQELQLALHLGKLSKETHTMLSPYPNAYVAELSKLPSLEALAAVIYSSEE